MLDRKLPSESSPQTVLNKGSLTSAFSAKVLCRVIPQIAPKEVRGQTHMTQSGAKAGRSIILE